ncbi:MAG: multidrug effflux MFS transporter [Flavobacteriaceae bacterium]|jgi:MFS transporter, DHA1 family, multidrug resistance protein|nr:multidrug effflux MFS transporter [Flavobacteriaceae bacterium]MDG1793254.1 multidrug effflux MFS transporter [Flavobacteriaceae bacterium]
MQNQPKLKLEFIAIMALLMSLVALSIDGILPALAVIGTDLGVTDTQKHQLLITMIFLGLGFGQLIFGPLSDSYGRKPIIYVGFLVFAIASIICVNTNSYEVLIAGRILQGIGLASPRTLSIAMIRDSYEGDYMAKVMSFIVMIFILVPIIAPTLGQYLMLTYNWQTIFNVQLGLGILVVFWFWKRQPETLAVSKRIPFRTATLNSGFIEFFKHKQAVAFTLISGFITGSFMVYLSTTQHIFEIQYDLGEDFPLIFASLAIGVGFATYLNGVYVVRIGMKRIALVSLAAYCLSALLYVVLFFNASNPPLWVLLTFFVIQFIAVGFLFGNLRALAMQPIGHIAGVGAAINGFISTVMGVLIASGIGAYVTTTAWPLFLGFSVCGMVSMVIFILNKPLERTI